MPTERLYFPQGRTRALTMSYDDGVVQDRRLVELFNRHGVRGTFHLNSGRLGEKKNLAHDEVATLFAGHEVSVHTVTHPHLPDLPADAVAREILEDRKALELLVGYPVRGMSYPYGHFDERIVAMLPSLGMEYARTVHSHASFDLPRDFLTWSATCHHRQNLAALAGQFLSTEAKSPMLMYVWGHSYEFDTNKPDNNWELIERFCSQVGRNDAVWYATNIEIVDYLRAARSLRRSVDGSMIHNPSGVSVWIGAGDLPVEVSPGGTVRLA